MNNKKKIIIILAMILLTAASRLVEHPFNFTPIAAMALFAGCYLKRWWGIVFPLGAMLVSDYFLGFYDWQVMASVYFSFILTFAIGWYLSRRLKWYNVFSASLSSSIAFFLITNFAVWAFFDWYPHTWSGLINCFTLALPFFRNTFLGDLVYSGLLFGVYEFILVLSAKKFFASAKI